MAVRIGMVGAGGIARHHVNQLKQIEDVKIVAVCDINRTAAQDMAAGLGAAVYVDHNTMYQQEKLDAVYVCVPPFGHLDIELQAAKRGIHIFVEKPVHLVLDKALAIRDEIEKSKVINSVAYCLRYLKCYQFAKETLAGKKAAMVTGYYLGGMPGTPWWRVKEKSGGQHTEQTTHAFDAVRYLCGDVKTVYARAFQGIMNKKVENYDIEDASIVNLEFESGTIGAVLSTCIIPQGHLRGVAVYCDELVIEVPGDRVKIIERGRTTEHLNTNNMYLDESKAFIEAVKTGKQDGILSSYRDGVETLRVTLAADQSMRTGKPVHLVRN